MEIQTLLVVFNVITGLVRTVENNTSYTSEVPSTSRNKNGLDASFRSSQMLPSNSTISVGLLAGSLTSPVPPKPVLSLYSIDESKPLHQTAIEVTEFVCGKTYFCNSIFDEEDEDDCFACQFPCSCEEGCEQFGDCCIDTVHNLDPLHTSPPLDCVPLGGSSFYMVSRCPKDEAMDGEVVNLCENPDLSQVPQSLPVSVARTHTTYRNQYCAICNGVEQDTFSVWTYKVSCHTNDSKQFDRDDLWRMTRSFPDVCSTEYFPPSRILPKYCPNGLVTRCHTTNHNPDEGISEQLCNQYISPIIHRGITYKNIFCAVCNGILLEKQDLCQMFVLEDDQTIDQTPRPLKAILNFDPMFGQGKQEETTNTKRTPTCDTGHVFDPFLIKCVVPLCAERRVLVRNHCEPLYSSGKGLGFTVVFTLVPSSAILDWDNFISDYQDMLHKVLGPLDPYYIHTIRVELFIALDERTGIENFVGATVVLDIVVLSNAPLLLAEEVLRNLQVVSWAYKSGGETIVIQSVPYECSNHVDEIRFDVLKEEVIRGSSDTIVQECGVNCLDQIDFAPLVATLDCPHVELHILKSDLILDQTTGTLTSVDGRISVNTSMYQLCRDRVLVCSRAFENVAVVSGTTLLPTTSSISIPENGTNKIEYFVEKQMSLTVVSTVCITVSLTILLIVLLINILLYKQRSVIDKNNTFAIVNLFLAQMFFLSGIVVTDNVALCRAMGILSHYFWISTFAWLTVSAQFVFSVCQKLSAEKVDILDEKSLLIRNLLISNGSPFIFVLLCLIYHLANSRGMETGYGGEVCYLYKPGDIGLYFAGPLTLSVGMNIYYFISTVGALGRLPDSLNESRAVQKCSAMLYFKWSIVMGVSWLFGCLAATCKSKVLWHIFIVLCLIQGIFILSVFCLNQITWKLLKDKFEAFVPKKIIAEAEVSQTHSTAV